MDPGQLDQGIDLLHHCLQLALGHSHACVALGLGYQRASDLPQAKKSTIPRLLPQKHFQEVQDIPAPEELRALWPEMGFRRLPANSRPGDHAWTAVFYPAGS